MPLHRDIHWIGRQWAVTGHGMQLIDQKLKGFFDIEASRLWEDALIESMRVKEWLNVADFDKGLSVARTRFPPGGVAQPRPEETIAPAAPTALPAAPPVASTTPEPAVAAPVVPIEPLPRIAKRDEPEPQERAAAAPPPAPAASQAPAITTPDPEPPKAPAPKFHMLFAGYAKFVRPWRVRIRK